MVSEETYDHNFVPQIQDIRGSERNQAILNISDQNSVQTEAILPMNIIQDKTIHTYCRVSVLNGRNEEICSYQDKPMDYGTTRSGRRWKSFDKNQL